MHPNFLVIISAIIFCGMILTCNPAVAEEDNQDVPEKKGQEDCLEGLRKIPEIELRLRLDSIFLDPHSNTDNVLSFGRFGLKGADILLKKSGCENLLTRAIKMLAVDYTLAYFFTTYNHELGHAYRAEEAGIPSEICMYVRNRFLGWNVNKIPFTSVYSSKKYAPDSVVPQRFIDELLIYIGGAESDVVMNNRLAEDMMKSETQTYYDSFLYLVGKAIHIDGFGNGERPDVSDGVTGKEYEQWCRDDLFHYMVLMDYLDVRISPSNIQSGGLWNMLDSFLAMSFLAHTIAYFGEGIRQLPMPRYMVATDYIIAPYGTEVALSFYYRNKKGMVTKVYGRKSMGQSYGAGVKIMNIPLKTKVSDKLNLGCDFWRQDFPELLERYEGSGISISIEAEKEVGKDVSLSLGIRAKTKGYVLGDRLGGGINIYAGVSIVW